LMNRYLPRLSWLLSSFCLLLSGGLKTQAQDSWQKNNQFVDTDDLLAITFFKGQFVISGNKFNSSSLWLMDEDGTITQAKQSPRFPIYSLAASGDRIVAGGEADYVDGVMTARSATSTNGSQWKDNSPVFEIENFSGLIDRKPHITDLVFYPNDNMFYGVATNSILRTTDGQNWERITSVGQPSSYLTAIGANESTLFAA
ncbi:MAG: hypothetical protein AAF485_13740, partial [Chloroflexota bacterium]